MTNQKKAEPFRVTGPGRYRTDCQNDVVIEDQRCINAAWPWKTANCPLENSDFWTDAGVPYSRNRIDGYLIARTDDVPAEEMAGIGFTEIAIQDAEVILGLKSWYRYRTDLGDGTYVDWSKVPLSAIVKPAPKTCTCCGQELPSC